jgi:hypothetical protein
VLVEPLEHQAELEEMGKMGMSHLLFVPQWVVEAGLDVSQM